jgi:peptidoglycan/LPS O-acetylase OafA/YrhL
VPEIEPTEGTDELVPAKRPGYIPGLDGLRAIAVLAVVAYHLDRLEGGFFGVDVFFVISGFLITRLLLAERERSGTVALGAFWIRRFKRLLPALLVVLVAVAIGSRLWLPAWRLGAVRLDALAGLAYVANWRFVLSGQSYFTSGLVPSPLRHTWSLAIEEQFYVFWPLIVVGVAHVAKQHVRRGVAVVAGVAMLLSATWMGVASSIGMDLSRIYYGTDTRVFALLGGALLGTLWDPAAQRGATRAARRRFAGRWAVAGTVALVPVLAFFVAGSNAEAVMYQGGFQLLALAAVVLVAGAATGRGVLSTVLSTPVLVWIGRRSYGIYLWSWPVQVFLSEYWGVDGYALDAAVFALAISFAAISFWLIEEPIRTGQRPAGFPAKAERDRDLEGRPRVPAFAVSCLAVVLVIGVVVGTSAGAPRAPGYTSVKDDEVLEAALGDLTEAQEEELLATTTPVPIEDSPPGPFTGADSVLVDLTASSDPSAVFGRPLKIMVAGDSVGWSVAWQVAKGVPPTVDVKDRAVIGCGVMPAEAEFIVHGRAPEQYGGLCQDAPLVEAKGLQEHPDVVLLWLGAWEVYDHEYQGTRYKVGTEPYADLLERRMQQRIDQYRGAGAATVMPLVPCFAATASRLGDERLDAERIAWVNERVRAVAARNPGWVRLIDPYEKLCDADGVSRRATPDGIPLREDSAHFDIPAAIWFWNDWLAGQVGAAFDVSQASGGTAAGN